MFLQIIKDNTAYWMTSLTKEKKLLKTSKLQGKI